MNPPVARVAGTAVYLNALREMTPLALRASVEHIRSLREAVVILSIETTRSPYVPESERLVVDDLGFADDGISHLTARFGFQDTPDVPRALALASKVGLETEVDVESATYFLSQVSVVPTSASGMTRWRKLLFVAMSRNAASPVEYFRLPPERTVTIGSQIKL